MSLMASLSGISVGEALVVRGSEESPFICTVHKIPEGFNYIYENRASGAMSVVFVPAKHGALEHERH